MNADIEESWFDRAERITKELEREKMELAAVKAAASDVHGRPQKYGFAALGIGDTPLLFLTREEYERAVNSAHAFGKRRGMRFSCRWDKTEGRGYIERVSIGYNKA